jgi:catechol 2,3-dioxygenase-like lactoylglutathione lyase family enzyme
MERTRGFYRDQLGLALESDGPFFSAYETGATTIAHVAVPAGTPPGLELCFEVDDIGADVSLLRSRGVTFLNEIRDLEFGRLIHARDPEGNLISLLGPKGAPQRHEPRGHAPVATMAPALTTVLLHCSDLGRATQFWRDQMGFPLGADTTRGVELEVGDTTLLLMPYARRPDTPRHAEQKIVCVLDVENLDEWFGQGARRQLRDDEIQETEFGSFVEIPDTEGHFVVIRQRPEMLPAPQAIAEDFEDDGKPVRSAIRKPVKKRSKAVSRVVSRPEYQARRAQTKTRQIARKKAVTQRAASKRGAGPERTRQEPHTLSDATRAKVKPAIGRAKKAVARSMGSKKTAVARRSRSVPVKDAAARRSTKRAGKRGRR